MTADLWAAVLRGAAPAAERFRAGLPALEAVQRAFLERLVRSNATSRFGREHGFSDIADCEAFRRQVPICDYADLEPYLDRAVAGGEGELATAPILFVEQTGGSTGGSKIVPYTQDALAGFENALLPWLADLADRRPGVTRGRAYFSLSPAGRTGNERIGALRLGNPLGFAYFGASGPPLRSLSVVPMSLAAMTDFAVWQEATCLHLLAAGDLSLVWVWSPTYLTELVRAMRANAERLVARLEEVAGSGEETFRVDPSRPAEVARALSGTAVDTERLWPLLDTVSCWMDASSAPFAEELQAMFPAAYLQPKGLMSTEASVSFPYGAGDAAALAHASGFFEFVDAAGVPHFAWQLAKGASYRVVVSTASGFYRYDTKDMVEVVGRIGSVPQIRFRGRAGLSSDLCGEKLTEEFVLKCLAATSGPRAAYAVLVASRAPHPRYRLYVDGAVPQAALGAFADALDAALGANPQYAYARRLGQLGPLVAASVPGLFGRVRDHLLAGGRGLAGMKAPALVAESGGAGLAEHLDRFAANAGLS